MTRLSIPRAAPKNTIDLDTRSGLRDCEGRNKCPPVPPRERDPHRPTVAKLARKRQQYAHRRQGRQHRGVAVAEERQAKLVGSKPSTTPC
jgi:hypothetical protein